MKSCLGHFNIKLILSIAYLVEIFHILVKNFLGFAFFRDDYLKNLKPEKQLAEYGLYQRGLKFITKIRSNMKNTLMGPWEKLMLQARGVIESVNNRLKNGYQIEHHSHRSPRNFLANLFGGLVAYQLSPNKPSIRLSSVEKLQLSL